MRSDADNNDTVDNGFFFDADVSVDDRIGLITVLAGEIAAIVASSNDSVFAGLCDKLEQADCDIERRAAQALFDLAESAIIFEVAKKHLKQK